MDLEVLATRVADDLRVNLQRRAPALRDVYAFCLYADPDGDFLASVGTEDEFARSSQLPAYSSRPASELRAWGGLRWDIGGWHRFPDDDFVTPATRAALQPLIDRLLDDSVTDEEFDAASLDWERLSMSVLEKAAPLQILPCTPDAIAFVNYPDTTPTQGLDVVARTVAAEQMASLFPGRETG